MIDNLSLRNLHNSTTFTDNMKLPVHRWFRYSAGFSSELVKVLAKSWNSKHILDPFGGSGTTNLAAQELGIKAYSFDVQPVIARVAKAKFSWDIDTNDFLNRAYIIAKKSQLRTSVLRPSSELIYKCFPDTEVLDSLLKLRDEVFSCNSGDNCSRVLWLAFLSIIRSVTPAGTAQWQYVLPNKKKKKVEEPISAFLKRCDLFAEDIKTRREMISSPASEIDILTSDARILDGVDDNWADTVITSPPYANNYDYADTTRLEQIVLGEINGWSDLKPLRNILIKSATQNVGRWKSEDFLYSKELNPICNELSLVWNKLSEIRKTKGGSKNYHSMVTGYFYDNSQVFDSLRKKTTRGANICYVVGDSAPYGVHVPVERWLGELALASGFKEWSFTKVRDRNTKWKNRKHTHPLHEGYLWIKG